MFKFNRWRSGTALLMALGLTTGTVTPLVASLITPTPAVAQTTNFSDVPSNYWAKDFITALAANDIIKGFPDGSFKPEDPVTRAQFAAMISKAFNKNQVREGVRFSDVPSNYWASSAILKSYEIGFLSGYPGNVFNPNQRIPREQVLVSLASGLNYAPTGTTATILDYFNDNSEISNYARNPIAAATEKKLVVNYPNLKFLRPARNATRAEVAAFIYQALVNSGQAQAINSEYVVSLSGTTPPTGGTAFIIPAGRTIPVKYNKEKILVTPDEKAPLTLIVDANISTADGVLLIPANTEVVGELQPVTGGGGTQFVAQNLVMADGRKMPIAGTSKPVTKTETIRKGASTGSVIKGAVLGAGAAAAIAAVTGDRAIATEEVLGGGGVGALIGLFLGRSRVDLIAIDPSSDLDITLSQDLRITK
jgi:hypothetical protein